MNRNVRGRLLSFSAFVAAAAIVGLLGKPGKADPRELQQGDSFPPTTHRRSRSLAEPSKRQDLGLFPRPRSPVFNVPPGDELTMRQLYDCLTELVAACQSSGFADLLKVDTEGRSPGDWRAEPWLLEQLRGMLYRVHRPDKLDERLALCFIIKTPDIFDQSRPRQDPVCMHLANGGFRMETDILLAQKTLCRRGPESPGVHFLCSRPVADTTISTTSASAVGVTMVPDSAVTSALESAELIRSRASRKTSTTGSSAGSSAGSRAAAEEKLKCALVWIVGVLLVLIIVLVAGILTHTLLNRQSYALAPATPQCFANDKTSLMEENGRCAGVDGGGRSPGGGGEDSPGPIRHSECVL